MAFKMNKNKAGSLYQKSSSKNSNLFKLRTGDEKDMEITDAGEITGHVKPRGYDESQIGIDKYPETKNVIQTTLRPGWTVKTLDSGKQYFKYKGEIVDNPDMSDVYKKTTQQVLHRGGEGINERDKERLSTATRTGTATRVGGESPKSNYMTGYAEPGSKKRKK